MCGIVGLYLKNEDRRPQLGEMFQPMLAEMKSRGPDSAGVAVYRNPAPAGTIKFSLAHDDEFDWKSVDTGLEKALNCDASIKPIGTHAILTTDANESAVTKWLSTAHPEVRIVGSGSSLEIFKEVGLPDAVYEQFNLTQLKDRT